MRAAVGLPPENHMLLEHRLASAGSLPVSLAQGAAAATAPGAWATASSVPPKGLPAPGTATPPGEGEPCEA
jgi:hypothetical protein